MYRGIAVNTREQVAMIIDAGIYADEYIGKIPDAGEGDLELSKEINAYMIPWTKRYVELCKLQTKAANAT